MDLFSSDVATPYHNYQKEKSAMANTSVSVAIEQAVIEIEDGSKRLGLVGICDRCDHRIEVVGRTEKSSRYLCARMREECPLSQSNYYYEES